MEVQIILAALIIVMGITMLLGKGDWMISGYNTASPEEKAQYNIRRLRLIMGISSILIALIMVISTLIDYAMLIPITVIPLCILILILGNTWGKN